MSKNKTNLLFSNCLAGITQKMPPIWMMRQAGRYHQHYQNLRANHGFMDLCKNPELAAEVAMGPIRDFDFDVAILFSDLLFPLEALGMGLEYTEQGPKLGFHLNENNFSNLKGWQDGAPLLDFQRIAMALTRERLPDDKSLIGFVGSPWTLFVYAVEGSHAGSLIQSKIKHNLWTKFCELLMPLLNYNIEIQIEGGAEIVMLFDTAAGELSPFQFENWVLPCLTKLATQFPKKLGYYSKGTQSPHYSKQLKSLPWAGLGYDHRWNLPEILRSGNSGFTQGNFDQVLLHLDRDSFKQTLNQYLDSFAKLNVNERAGWVCGLGHGVLPKTPEYNVKFFVDEVRRRFK